MLDSKYSKAAFIYFSKDHLIVEQVKNYFNQVLENYLKKKNCIFNKDKNTFSSILIV